MLIQNGFPIINKFGEYPEQIPPPRDITDLPGGDDQTQEVLRLGNAHRGERFAVQHNGLQACPATGECRDPNYMVRNKGDLGWVTGLQTTNAGSPKDTLLRPDAGVRSRQPVLGAAERRHQRPGRRLRRGLRGAVLGGEDAGRRPLSDRQRQAHSWPVGRFFHARRRALFPDLRNPEPTAHSHTFARTQAGTAPQSLHYANGATCGTAPRASREPARSRSCRPS